MLTLDYQTDAAPKALWYPSEEQVHTWLMAALAFFEDEALEVTVRLVDDASMQELNHTYRGKDYATNILSFPFDSEWALSPRLLGDMVIAVAVVNREAQEQGKNAEAHWAHMCVHGLLHLLGYDHIEEEEAEEMEQLERDILATLNIADPYRADEEE